LFTISDFIVVFEPPNHANTLAIFGFGRAQRASKKSRFYKKSLEMSNFGRSYLGIYLADFSESMFVAKVG
jgi:hypothetical protein